MLRDLHVQNLAVIAEAEIRFGDGLNVLTGETGAGKSIVVDCLALLSGARASSELIRTGADVLSVTGIFAPGDAGWREVLAEAGLDSEAEQLVVRREINRQGRNRVFLDDQPVTLGLLSAVAPHLIRIHTQREELGLVSTEVQRAWLDRSGGTEGHEPAAAVERAFARYREAAQRLERVAGNEQLRQERIDLLTYQGGEIDAARLEPGEDERLRAERELLRHGEAISEALSRGYADLFDEEGAVVERLSRATRQLSEIGDWETHAGAWVAKLESLRVGVEDLAQELRDRLAALDLDPGRLDAVEERLTLIDRLARKYGRSCSEILEHRQRMGAELDDLTADESRRAAIEAEVEEALVAFREAAGHLSTCRRRWAAGFSDRVHEELADLAMDKARFAVELGTRRREDSPLRIEGEPVDFSLHGYDRVRYLLAANPGEAAAPLSRSASGGELSRVFLAVQLASRGAGEAAATTLVFDEVDAGIGGAQAEALGRKLARLATGGQILAVTHLPQIASQADRHFRVEKRVREERTLTEVVRLDEGQRVEEVARMLGGREITELTRSHAEEMIATAVEARR